MWTIGKRHKKDHRYYRVVTCKKCGATTNRRETQMFANPSCKTCNTVTRNRKSLGKHRGCGQLTKTFYNYFKYVAKRRDILFDVSIEYLWNLFVAQGERCALSGLPLEFPKYTDGNGNSLKKSNTPSLDRIDSSLPYMTGNVQWVHKSVNIMKNRYSQSEFIHFCQCISTYHANPEPILPNEFNHVGRQVQRLTGEDIQTNKPDTSAQHPLFKDDDIVRHSNENWRLPLLKEVSN